MNQKKSVTILMADDDADDREMARDAFAEARLGNDLRFANDGVELLDYLYRRGKFSDPKDAPSPGIILLDLNMPRLDGLQALREIRNDERFRHIRVVVLTTSNSERDILASYNLSAASYITKPVTFEQLVEVIRSFGKYWLEIVEIPDVK